MRTLREVLIEAGQQLIQYAPLFDIVMRTLRDVREKGYADTRQILPIIVTALRWNGDAFKPEQVKELARFRDELTGSSFHDRLRRYVGIRIHDEEFDDEGKPVTSITERIGKLADEALRTPTQLTVEFPWLVTPAPENGYRFGFELGMRDNSYSLFAEILSAQTEHAKAGSLSFLGGYLRGDERTVAGSP